MSTRRGGSQSGHEVTFGPYTILDRLGVGGMATVHRARERGIEGFERTVALKRLLPHLAEDEQFVRAFVREAKLSSMLHHANIVQLHELGRVGHTYFISMEYVDGRDLRQLLRRARDVAGPPPIGVALSILCEVCDALGYAHSRVDDQGKPLGIIHRDVSPSNILISRSGHVKIIDFGIAKATALHARTQTGRVKGKMAYMAPEAIKGQVIDARADLFSVGIIVHELLTAQPLFASKTDYDTLLRVQNADVLPPSFHNPLCPPGLDDIVLKALSKQADDRFASAGEMGAALHQLRVQQQLDSSPTEVAKWMRWAFELQDSGSDSPALSSRFVRVPSAAVEAASDLTPVSVPVQPPPIEADDHIAEIAWGSADNGVPVLLDDVPDRSGAIVHRAPLLTNDGYQAALANQGQAEARESGGTLIAYVPPPPQNRTPVRFPRGSAPPFSQRLRRPTQGPGRSLRKRLPTQAGEIVPDPGELSWIQTPPRGVEPTLLQPLDEQDSPTIGTSIVADRQRRRTQHVLIGLVVVGAVVVVGLLLGDTVARSNTPLLQPVSPTTGTLRFIVEPAEASITIRDVGVFSGGRELALNAGAYRVRVEHSGFKVWARSIEVLADETKTMHVVLEEIPAQDATVLIQSTPSNQVVKLDGVIQSTRTPLTLRVEPGKHEIIVMRRGRAVWRRTFMATAGARFEFHAPAPVHRGRR